MSVSKWLGNEFFYYCWSQKCQIWARCVPRPSKYIAWIKNFSPNDWDTLLANLDAIKTSSKVLPAGQISTHSTFSDTFPPAMRRQQRPIVLQMLQITAVKLPSHFLLFWDLLQCLPQLGSQPSTKKGAKLSISIRHNSPTDKKARTIVLASPQWAVNLLHCPHPFPKPQIAAANSKKKKEDKKKWAVNLLHCPHPFPINLKRSQPVP